MVEGMLDQIDDIIQSSVCISKAVVLDTFNAHAMCLETPKLICCCVLKSLSYEYKVGRGKKGMGWVVTH